MSPDSPAERLAPAGFEALETNVLDSLQPKGPLLPQVPLPYSPGALRPALGNTAEEKGGAAERDP